MSKWIERLKSADPLPGPTAKSAESPSPGVTPALLTLLAPAPEGGSRQHVMPKLAQSIDRCCDLRGDSEANRLALLGESATLTDIEQMEMQEHFEEQSRMWRRVNRGIGP